MIAEINAQKSTSERSPLVEQVYQRGRAWEGR